MARDIVDPGLPLCETHASNIAVPWLRYVGFFILVIRVYKNGLSFVLKASLTC